MEFRIGVNLGDVVEEADLDPAFDALVKTIMESKFGSMLSMFGGAAALETMRGQFNEKMRIALIALAESDQLKDAIKAKLHNPEIAREVMDKVSSIVHSRLDEMTPDMVKEIIQKMIDEHLGWLVIWGGVFGGLLGLIARIIQNIQPVI